MPLRTRRPSPCTVEFTYSDRPPLSPLQHRTYTLINLILRSLAIVVAGLGVLLKLEKVPDEVGWVRGLAPVWVWVLGAGVLWSLPPSLPQEESLLALRSLGLQTTSSRHPFPFFSSASRFIPISAIKDVIIHEAIIGLEVRYYLAVLVEGEDVLEVVFGGLVPRRGVLEEVWRGVRE
ncbi:hypothetical protein SAICODRAFT_64490, partial [Saitoella complicata NRRL Y-17804]|uniref:uncharacterized protein n=1 Tax=Saitoella complicata (strain BCRC 22490 / CBS 7301 / JCM 7358 / NBRC 10748 / NRRL Y-17804) TaxID=698492 RepID=UPI0008679B59